MDLETKLDEDFIFYLGFANPFLKHVRDADTKVHCERWLKKLCGENYNTIEEKRCRNIFLSQLLICMQTGVLIKEFLLPPTDVDILEASEIFKLTTEEDEEPPSWLTDNDYTPDSSPTKRRGRTYVATRTLPDGKGCFAYIAVSLDDQDPMMLGGGEGSFDKRLEQEYEAQVPDYEMEKILAKRKDPEEREKVLTFYKTLLQNIVDELDEKIVAKDNDTISGLVEQLKDDLKEQGVFGEFQQMTLQKQRTELLLILHDRIYARMDAVAKREELLDDYERHLLSKSLFETSVTEADKMKLPATMWEQVINKAPSKKNMDKLKAIYPLSLIERFLELLSDYKEQIAMKMQRRHENIIAQMKKEVRKEDEKGKKVVDAIQRQVDYSNDILDAVREAYSKKQEAEKKNTEEANVPISAHSKLYDEMRAALYNTQKSVEEEAAVGRALAAEINTVTEMTEAELKENEANIKKMEAANMIIMRNIKRLNEAIKMQQEKINSVQNIDRRVGKSEQFDVFL